ncbi:hypothetical protein K490DRAFT_12334, partial [Saccharata proteae CBS 121410]
NRKERRAAAKKGDKNDSSESTQPYELKKPDYNARPQGKTLYDLADERMKELQKQGQPFPKQSGSMEAEEIVWPDDEPLGPAAEAVLYASSLTMLHFTLDVLVHNQYRENIVWKEIWKRTGVVLPLLFVLVYSMRTKLIMRFPTFRQVLFLGASVAAGCYTVYSGNMHGYYAVMKRAPPVGTMWVWMVVEMDLGYALASVLAVLGYTLWNGFGFW